MVQIKELHILNINTFSHLQTFLDDDKQIMFLIKLDFTKNKT